jgi:hypothetical protein
MVVGCNAVVRDRGGEERRRVKEWEGKRRER